METEARKGQYQVSAVAADGCCSGVFAVLRVNPTASTAELRVQLDHGQRFCAEIERVLRSRQPRQRNLVREAKTFIATNLAEPLTVKIVAGKVGLASSEFSRRWNQATRGSLPEYVARLRVKRAKVLLRESAGQR